jgi:hypothetical protein
MRHIFTVSIDPELEKEIDEYQRNMGFQTRSEGAIRLLRSGLKYQSDIESLQGQIKALEGKPNAIHLPCSVCGKPMTISESDDDPIYNDMKGKYKNWGHTSCTERQGVRK